MPLTPKEKEILEHELKRRNPEHSVKHPAKRR